MTGRRRLSAVPETPRLAVISLRVSRVMGRDGDTFHAPDLQEDACRRFCAERGWVVVGVVTDLDVSGGVFDRPGLNEALRMLETGEATALVTYDVSRLGRKVKETLDVIDRVRATGAVYASVKERFDDTPEGEHLLHTFLSIAHLYRRQRGRGWQEVIARRAERGLWHGSNPPYGYRIAAAGLEIDPDAARLVVDAFDRYALGHLVSHIARDIGRTRGRVLAVSQLKRMFYNPVYVGRLHLNGEEHDGRHERLIDEKTWQQVQLRLERDRRTPSRRLAVSHSLVGLVVCDHCGRNLQLHVDPPRAGRAHDVPRLQCRLRMQGGAEKCTGPGSPAVALVEAAVLEALRGRVTALRSEGEERASQQARRARAGVDVGRLRRELDKTETALAVLTVDRARREITEQAYRLAAAELEQAAEALRRQLDVARDVQATPAPRGTVAAVDELLRLWDVALPDERNRLLRRLIREVRVRRSRGYREPFTVEPGGRVQVDWL